jgi:hypothetical protein
MRVILGDEEKAALLVVLANARNVMLEEEGKAGKSSLAGEMRRGRELLEDLQKHVGNLELTYGEAEVVADLIRHSLSALEGQEASEKGEALSQLKASEGLLRTLHERVRPRRIDLDAQGNLALGTLLQEALSILQGASVADEATRMNLERGLATLVDVHRRLCGLDLSSAEAELLQDLVEQLSEFFERRKSGSDPETQAQLEMSTDLLGRLRPSLQHGSLQLEADQWVALLIVLENALSILRTQPARDETVASTLKKGEEELRDLYARLLGLEVIEPEAELLQDVVRLNIEFIDKEMKGAGAGSQDGLKGAKRALLDLQTKLSG